MSIFLDTSFLVSLYSIDANSAEAVLALHTAPNSEPFLLTDFAALEVVNALQLRQFREQDTDEQVRRCVEAFDQDVSTGRFQLRAMPGSAFQRVRELSIQTTARLGTRTSDLLHVACALELGATGFFSFDKQQLALAEAVELKLNP